MLQTGKATKEFLGGLNAWIGGNPPLTSRLYKILLGDSSQAGLDARIIPGRSIIFTSWTLLPRFYSLWLICMQAVSQQPFTMDTTRTRDAGELLFARLVRKITGFR
jgi:hypothetical protein